MFNCTVCNSFAVIIQETDNDGVHFDNIFLALKGIEISNFFSETTF